MIIIKTEKFNLRLCRKGDEISIAKHVNNKKIARNTLAIPYPYTLKDAESWIGKKIAQYKSKSSEDIVFVIEIGGEACGAIGLHKIKENHKAELGYWLGESHWGKNIMTEATKLVVNFAFKELGLKRVYAYVFLSNEASKRVLEKAGFELEGICKKGAKKGNKYMDEYLLAITK